MERFGDSDPKNSFVWRHFQTSDVSGYATCIYCKKDFGATDEDTSELSSHLTKCHQTNSYKPIKQVVPYEPKSYKIVSNLGRYLVPKIEEKRLTRHRSYIWKKFTPKDNFGTVECNNCKRELKSAGKVSNLKRHYLNCFNRLEKGDGNQKTKGFIWNHFDKCRDNPNHVICRYCKRIYTCYKNKGTYNLKDHMLRFHKSIMIDMGLIKQCEQVENDGKSSVDDGVIMNVPVAKRSLKRKNTSFVWQHYQKTKIKYIVICNYCLKVIRTWGSTSNMRFHLMKYHKEYISSNSDSNIGQNEQEITLDCNNENLPMDKDKVKVENNDLPIVSDEAVDFATLLEGITYDGESIILNSDSRERKLSIENYCKENEIGRFKRKRSFVWRHFKGAGSLGEATCNYCSKICKTTGGNTSTLRAHLIKFHLDRVQVQSEILPMRKRGVKLRSLVWEHYEKSRLSKEAICLHCGNTFGDFGNTSNLRDHLERKHPNEYEVMVNEENNPNTTDEISLAVEDIEYETQEPRPERMKPGRKISSFVWEHFKKSDDYQKAVCNYCDKELNTFGNTTSLRTHLFRHHRQKISTTKENMILDETSGFLLTDNENVTEFDQKNQTEEENSLEDAEQVNIQELNLNKPVGLIWKHFSKNMDTGLTSCVYCNKTFSQRFTSNLWRHLIRFHNNLVEEDVKKKLTRNTSLVWNHFRKDPLNRASCFYCKKTFNTFGSTSNLWKHLTTRHPEIMDLIGGEVVESYDSDDAEETPDIEENTNVTMRGKPRSVIWEHFRRKKNSMTALCLHCNNMYCCKSTSLLWGHLRGQHKEYVPDTAEDEETFTSDKSEAWKTFIEMISEKTNYELDVGSTNENENLYEHRGAIVRNYFDISEDSDKAICVYCREEYSRDMIQLCSHLLKEHKQLVTSDIKYRSDKETYVETILLVNDESKDNHEEDKEHCDTSSVQDEEENFSDENDEECLNKRVGRNRSSHVWKYFSRIGKTKRATCIYCKKIYSFCKSTSNLWRHLLISHKEQFEKAKRLCDEKPSDTINIYCDKESRTFKDTNLSLHLTLHHKVVVDPNDEKEILEVLDSTGQNVYTTSVWGFFEKISTPQFAVCSYCQLWCELGKDSSNLRNHLIKCHRDDFKGVTTNESVEQCERNLSERSCDDTSPVNCGQTDDKETDLWDSFTQSAVPNFVTCNHCGKMCSEIPSVMAGHLKIHQDEENNLYANHHNEEINISDDKIEAESDEHRTNKTMSSTGHKSRRSTVWNHFKCTKDRYWVLCVHCKKKMRYSGNTTNLQGHLTCHHPELLNERELKRHETMLLRRKQKMQHSQVEKTKKSSFVWRHFTKSETPQYAECNHCRTLCNSCGNTTNLWDHLLRHHEGVFDDDIREVTEEDVEYDIKDFLKLEPPDPEEERPNEHDYGISEDDLKKAAASANVNGMDDYVILVVA